MVQFYGRGQVIFTNKMFLGPFIYWCQSERQYWTRPLTLATIHKTTDGTFATVQLLTFHYLLYGHTHLLIVEDKRPCRLILTEIPLNDQFETEHTFHNVRCGFSYLFNAHALII